MKSVQNRITLIKFRHADEHGVLDGLGNVTLRIGSLG